METYGTPQPSSVGRPTPEEASAALHEAGEAKASITSIPTPRWYYTSLAALVAVLPVIKLPPSTLPGVTATLVLLVVWLALFGLAVRMHIRTVGFAPRLDLTSKRRWWVIGAAAIMAVAVALVYIYDRDWIYFVGSGTVAALILTMGALLRRHARKDT